MSYSFKLLYRNKVNLGEEVVICSENTTKMNNKIINFIK